MRSTHFSFNVRGGRSFKCSIALATFESELANIDPVLALSLKVGLFGGFGPFLPNELVLTSPEPLPSARNLACELNSGESEGVALKLSGSLCLFVCRYDGELGVDAIYEMDDLLRDLESFRRFTTVGLRGPRDELGD